MQRAPVPACRGRGDSPLGLSSTLRRSDPSSSSPLLLILPPPPPPPPHPPPPPPTLPTMGSNMKEEVLSNIPHMHLFMYLKHRFPALKDSDITDAIQRFGLDKVRCEEELNRKSEAQVRGYYSPWNRSRQSSTSRGSPLPLSPSDTPSHSHSHSTSPPPIHNGTPSHLGQVLLSHPQQQRQEEEEECYTEGGKEEEERRFEGRFDILAVSGHRQGSTETKAVYSCASNGVASQVSTTASSYYNPHQQECHRPSPPPPPFFYNEVRGAPSGCLALRQEPSSAPVVPDTREGPFDAPPGGGGGGGTRRSSAETVVDRGRTRNLDHLHNHTEPPEQVDSPQLYAPSPSPPRRPLPQNGLRPPARPQQHQVLPTSPCDDAMSPPPPPSPPLSSPPPNCYPSSPSSPPPPPPATATTPDHHHHNHHHHRSRHHNQLPLPAAMEEQVSRKERLKEELWRRLEEKTRLEGEVKHLADEIEDREKRQRAQVVASKKEIEEIQKENSKLQFICDEMERIILESGESPKTEDEGRVLVDVVPAPSSFQEGNLGRGTHAHPHPHPSLQTPLLPRTGSTSSLSSGGGGATPTTPLLPSRRAPSPPPPNSIVPPVATFVRSTTGNQASTPTQSSSERRPTTIGSDDGGGKGWSCSKCTFLNSPFLNQCEMCDFPHFNIGTPPPHSHPPSSSSAAAPNPAGPCYCHQRHHHHNNNNNLEHRSAGELQDIHIQVRHQNLHSPMRDI